MKIICINNDRYPWLVVGDIYDAKVELDVYVIYFPDIGYGGITYNKSSFITLEEQRKNKLDNLLN